MERKKRPRCTSGITERVETGCGHLYVIVNRDESGAIFELFVKLGKAGGCAMSQSEAICRAISTGLRYGVPPEEYVQQLQGVRCPNLSWDAGEQVLSCADAISKVLGRELKSGSKSA